MKTSKKSALLIASIAIIAGAAICVVALVTVGFDFVKLGTDKYVGGNIPITEDFTEISVDTDVDVLVFAISPDKSCSISLSEREGERHEAMVKNGQLIIKKSGIRSIFNFGINTDKSSMTLFLPRGEYAALSIKADSCDISIPKDFSIEQVRIQGDTGDIDFYAAVRTSAEIATTTGNITAGDFIADDIIFTTDTGRIRVLRAIIGKTVSIESDTGNVMLEDIKCPEISVETDTGDAEFVSTVASDKFLIETDTGDVTFKESDANEVFIQTDTGDVSGSFLTDKVFIIETDTGNVSVPKTVTGGRCEIETNTGDIKFE